MIALLLALAAPPTPEQVFAARIEPIFKSPNPSSCIQCHLAGVDLKNYIRPSSRETFLSLRDQGLVDLDKPEKSRILALIDMGKGEKGAVAVHEKNRAAEYEAFAAWVKACAADPALRTAPKLNAKELAKPARPNEVIRHARRDRLLESFESSVWAMRFRCMNCHTEGSDKSKELAAKHGDRVMWFKAAGPEATLKYLIDEKMIDPKQPEKSLLLRKPLKDGVEHGGGVKFVTGDQGYKVYRRFLDDYAATVGDKYAAAADLPKPPATLLFGTDAWLKITNTPPAWADKLVTVKLYARKPGGGWEAEPVATSDRRVWGGGKLWQHSLTLFAPRDSDRAKAWRAAKPTLPPGTYLVRVYLDATGRMEKDWAAEVGDAELVGEAEVTSDWPTGYGKMTVLDAGRVKKR